MSSPQKYRLLSPLSLDQVTYPTGAVLDIDEDQAADLVAARVLEPVTAPATQAPATQAPATDTQLNDTLVSAMSLLMGSDTLKSQLGAIGHMALDLVADGTVPDTIDDPMVERQFGILRAARQVLLGDGAGLTKDGIPTVKALASIAGHEVTAAERDAATGLYHACKTHLAEQ